MSETISTLEFAKRAKMMRNEVTINEDTVGNIVDLKQEIKSLKAQLDDMRKNIEVSDFSTMISRKPNLQIDCLLPSPSLRDMQDELHSANAQNQVRSVRYDDLLESFQELEKQNEIHEKEKNVVQEENRDLKDHMAK
jgi:hypothetical protein